MTDSNIESLGRQIARDRRRAGLSIGDMAECTGLAKSTIHRIETDTLENRPQPESLQKIARCVGTEVEDYLALAGYLPATGLPGLTAYLRAKYEVPDELAGEVEDYFTYLCRRSRDDGTDDENRATKGGTK